MPYSSKTSENITSKSSCACNIKTKSVYKQRVTHARNQKNDKTREVDHKPTSNEDSQSIVALDTVSVS